MTSTATSPKSPHASGGLHASLGWLALATVVAVVPNWIFLFVLGRQGVSYGGLIVGLTLAFLALLITEALTRWVLKVLTLTLALAPLLAWFIIEFHGYPDQWAVIILAEANTQEIQQHLGYLFSAGATGTLLAWVHWRWLVRRSYSGIRLDGGMMLWLLRVVVLMPMLFLLGRDLARGGWGRVTSGMYQRLAASYPASLPLAWLDACATRRQLAARTPQSLLETIESKYEQSGEREVHVLVLGESARASSFQINGYSRPTTPRLTESLKEICNFTNVIAPATVTAQAVPLLLTDARTEQADEAGTLPSLVGVFRRAGFRTAWISTQPRIGYSETMASLFSRDAHESQFLTGTMSEMDFFLHSPHDGELVGPLSKFLARGDKLQFVVLHSMGSHWSYPARYPASQAVFPSTLRASLAIGNRPRSPEQKQDYTNAYDNTICYTDKLLGELIELLRQSGACASLWYVSDHGETTVDEPQPCLHGVDTRSVLHVPMLVWTSQALRMARPEIVARLAACQNMPLSSRVLFHTLPGLAGIRSALVNETMDLSSDGFKPSRRLYLRLGEKRPVVYGGTNLK